MSTHQYIAMLGCVLNLMLGCAPSDESSMDASALSEAMNMEMDMEMDMEIDTEMDALEEPERGIQVATNGREIPAGADEEWCEVVEISGDPDEEFFVARTEVAMTAYSHHLIISMAPKGSLSLVDEPLNEPVRCDGAHQFGQDLTTLAGAAKPYVESVMPEGIGYTLRGGQRLLFDYHAFNTTDEPILAKHQLNLHFVDHIEKPARTFGFYNQYFQVPPGELRAFIDECQFKDDVLVWALTRHTHRQGRDFRVWWSGGQRDGELIWTSRDWEQDIHYRFDEPVVVSAGTGFRWECELENLTDETLVFGPQATDEMCILFGLFAAVGDDSEVEPQSCYLFSPP